jgi:hypothetical protein
VFQLSMTMPLVSAICVKNVFRVFRGSPQPCSRRKIPGGVLPEASYWDTADPYHFLRVDKHCGFSVRHELVLPFQFLTPPGLVHLLPKPLLPSVEAYHRKFFISADVLGCFFHHDPLRAGCGSCLPPYTVYFSLSGLFIYVPVYHITWPQKTKSRQPAALHGVFTPCL